MPSPRPRSLADWLAALETLAPREIELGLARVEQMLARLPMSRPRRVLHVAGTNGKGSTVAMLESLYRGQGSRVACYTSPHVLRFNERLRIDGCDADDDSIVAAFSTVESVRDGVPLTYFEFATLAALVAFSTARVDVWILEIGLGGRLDAVNAVDPDGAVITNVALDHCDWLGDDVESIAREKAGIMRAAIPVVYGASPAPQAVIDCARDLGADLRLAGQDYRFSADDGRWRFEGREATLDSLPRPALAGRFQLANAAAALALYEALEGRRGLAAADPGQALGALVLPGRLQRVDTDRRWLLDAAHNPAAAAALAAELPAFDAPGGLTAVLGVLADKDLDGMLAPLLPLVDRWIAVPADSPRAVPARQLAERIAEAASKPCRVADDVAAGLAEAARISPADALIVVSGSFYTIGPALARLEPVAASALGYTRGAS